MPLKKSDLYSSIWASCDALRGGMDPSQYKDYVLFMLFIKYVSDKYADSDDLEPAVVVPTGAGFRDMVAMKGKAEIGDRINKEVIAPLVAANAKFFNSDFPNFNDPAKLGKDKAMVELLTDLISIFEKPELNFAQHRAEDDDLLGDAYEYLMRHFATESGKSKGQFYTPAEVSRIMAQVIGIGQAGAKADTTAYDPTCGSGSLLLKVAAEAGAPITLYGQERDVSTAGLARMNMVLHDFPTASIKAGNTLADPLFTTGESLQTFDYVVANPPFSDKKWITGLVPATDKYQRFAWGEPPNKQGDYAYLLHIIRSMKGTGVAACILPHGVLFRGNAEAVLRKRLVDSGYLKGIIGLPANLFYGTGIPACILVLDKNNAAGRRHVFMIDASKGYVKDGPKNKLRAQDVHRIVDAFRQQREQPRYARLVPVSEISGEKNDYNLNLPRYIDTSEPEDRQDINAHLRGGIPVRDVDALGEFWEVLPGIRATLFEPSQWDGYLQLRTTDVKAAILEHEEFVAFRQNVQALFDTWCAAQLPVMDGFGEGDKPKVLIGTLSESLLAAFAKTHLLDPYDLYQHLMSYWAATMEDDAYLVAAQGWVAKPEYDRVLITSGKKKGQTKLKGWDCTILPKDIVIQQKLGDQLALSEALNTKTNELAAELESILEENGGDSGALDEVSTKKEVEEVEAGILCDIWLSLEKADFEIHEYLVQHIDKLLIELRLLGESNELEVLKNKKGRLLLRDVKAAASKVGDDSTAVRARQYQKLDADIKRSRKKSSKMLNEFALRLDRGDYNLDEELNSLLDARQAAKIYLKVLETARLMKADAKNLAEKLDDLAFNTYSGLNDAEIKALTIHQKWLATLRQHLRSELDRVSQRLTGRVKELSERYDKPLSSLEEGVEVLSARVNDHLKTMGALWN